MIKFGTSGWRALYHEDFIRPNIEIVIQAIADEIGTFAGASRGVAVGYDVRFMGREFACLAAEILAGNGIPALVTVRDVPTPALSHAIVARHLAGGINFTASHNPYQYNGVKYSPESGGPALPEVTQRIEQRIANLLQTPAIRRRAAAQAREGGLWVDLDPRPAYLQALDGLLYRDAFRQLVGKTIAVDCKHAVARGYLDEYLGAHGVDVTVLHGDPDPYFGYEHPEPGVGHLRELQACVSANPTISLGLACDGDADRFGVVDADGSFVEANVVLALLLDYLTQSRGWKGGVARSVATTHLLDRVAALHGLALHETPVGFKFIGDLLTKGLIVFGGEESAGLTIQGHLPEKDGILACLLVAEMIAATGKSLHELRADLFRRVGAVYNDRRGVSLTPETERCFTMNMAHIPDRFAGKCVEKIDRTDGTKLILSDGEWVLFRKSGTEPLVRIYAEAATPERVARLLDATESWLMER